MTWGHLILCIKQDSADFLYLFDSPFELYSQLWQNKYILNLRETYRFIFPEHEKTYHSIETERKGLASSRHHQVRGHTNEENGLFRFLLSVLFLLPPHIGHDAGKQAGDQCESQNDPVENFLAQKKGTYDEEQSHQTETFAAQAVSLAPDFLTG